MVILIMLRKPVLLDQAQSKAIHSYLLSLNIILEGLSIVENENYIKGIGIGKEVKLLLFAGDMIFSL